MRSENRNNYESMKKLYYRWLNERDVFEQRRLKEEIKSRFSPYEFLNFSIKNSFMPFKAFRNIYSLDVLFQTLEKMQRQGEDISHLTNQQLVISNPEDIKSINTLAKRETSPEIKDFCIVFSGSSAFTSGDIKTIGKKLSNVHVKNLKLEQIENMVKTQKDYKGIPITITIENIGQLPLEKLANIEKFFDIEAVKIQGKDVINRDFNQGQSTPLNLKTYKEIRAVADDILGKLYVTNKTDRKDIIDCQLATQIINNIAQRVEYDYEAAEKPRDSIESMYASGMLGLLTGKSICRGYSEILKNLLSCVDIECSVISGTDMNGEKHAWNQVKLGDEWYNVDLTYASNALRNGNATGDLFMSDDVFYGDRRRCTFEKGREVNGKNVETTVMIGGHSTIVDKPNCKKCKRYITPYGTSFIIERAKQHEEDYKRNGKSADYEGAVPYIGSSIEKKRSSAKNIETPTYSEH